MSLSTQQRIKQQPNPEPHRWRKKEILAHRFGNSAAEQPAQADAPYVAPLSFALGIAQKKEEKLNKVAKGIGLALFVFWGASTAYELASRAPGESISIFGQLFFSVGLPYFVLILIVLWFIKTTGLNRLPSYLDRLDSYLASNNTKKRAKKKKGG